MSGRTVSRMLMLSTPQIAHAPLTKSQHVSLQVRKKLIKTIQCKSFERNLSKLHRKLKSHHVLKYVFYCLKSLLQQKCLTYYEMNRTFATESCYLYSHNQMFFTDKDSKFGTSNICITCTGKHGDFILRTMDCSLVNGDAHNVVFPFRRALIAESESIGIRSYQTYRQNSQPQRLIYFTLC